MVKIIGLDLISGADADPTTRLRSTVETAVLFEQLGFDGYAVGERHHPPFLSSSPPVVLSHIAALTSRIRLFTGVTLLSVLDPVRVAEDYATLDHLSGGRVELIIGKGNGPEQAELFGIGRTEAWDTIEQNYRLLRRLWDEPSVTWSPAEGVPSIRRTPLVDATVSPKPLQERIRIWHGSASSERSVELAAEFGDPIFSANAANPIDRYAELIDHYRERRAAHGHDPATAVVGAGHAVHVARTSQQARAAFEPFFAQFQAAFTAASQLPGTFTHYADYEDFLARSSVLVGSPDEVVDKLGRYHERFGHSVVSITADPGPVDTAAHRASLELFATDVVPRLGFIADPPWGGVSSFEHVFDSGGILR